MAAEAVWDDDAHSIIRIDVAPGFTWPEMHRAIQDAVELAKQQSGRVDLIINNPYGLPPGYPLPQLRRSVGFLQTIPNLGIVVAINPRQLPGFLRALIDILTRSFGPNWLQEGRFVNTLEEARQRITNQRGESAAA